MNKQKLLPVIWHEPNWHRMDLVISRMELRQYLVDNIKRRMKILDAGGFSYNREGYLSRIARFEKWNMYTYLVSRFFREKSFMEYTFVPHMFDDGMDLVYRPARLFVDRSYILDVGSNFTQELRRFIYENQREEMVSNFIDVYDLIFTVFLCECKSNIDKLSEKDG